jgi:hypothetical protein
MVILWAFCVGPVKAGPFGFADFESMDQTEAIPRCRECSFIATLESAPDVSDPWDTAVILGAMGMLALIGFAGMRWRVQARRPR